MTRLMLTTAAALLPGVALAHPGHGPEAGLQHYLGDPFHLLGAVLVVGSVTLLGAWAVRARSRAASVSRPKR